MKLGTFRGAWCSKHIGTNVWRYLGYRRNHTPSLLISKLFDRLYSMAFVLSRKHQAAVGCREFPRMTQHYLSRIIARQLAWFSNTNCPTKKFHSVIWMAPAIAHIRRDDKNTSCCITIISALKRIVSFHRYFIHFIFSDRVMDGWNLLDIRMNLQKVGILLENGTWLIKARAHNCSIKQLIPLLY